MKELLRRLWKEEEGAETVEYLVIVAGLVTIALIVYVAGAAGGGTLSDGLDALATWIVSQFPGAAAP
jgi:Flp pilus assembly pilin Flp